ncbi:5-formyltetrahydrofolate cyclo-ligase [Bacillus mangrovi]|uniref:5-formyltetrahydrofolate cyclo-ligase n=1 Tax=Metabacillus mangrovi TaxID=1491830 RepID=A0A7X2S3A7_9BACI|nr:5-formyltetrahydrofolate cyclo-ligase [Metabacillus mangrovi]MTH52418.1 5-formyltetrahydrofolate cyclo-ligase [Metabacillus mangrovi]
MNKAALRARMKIRLQQMSEAEFRKETAEIQELFLQSDSWKNSRTIGLTISQNREADTKRLIEEAWRQGKGVAVPKCYPADRSMEFRLLTSYGQLETVYSGLKEPVISETLPAGKSSIDVMAVPGICFDPRGYRIGYGGGYYDRYLSDFKGETVSLAFSFQILPLIPAERYDVPVRRIITENEVLQCRE